MLYRSLKYLLKTESSARNSSIYNISINARGPTPAQTEQKTFIFSHEPLDEPIARLKDETKRLGITQGQRSNPNITVRNLHEGASSSGRR
jgi:hypothetical protein